MVMGDVDGHSLLVRLASSEDQ